MSSVAPYKIVYVNQDGTTFEMQVAGAPRPAQLFTKIRGHTGYYPNTDKNKVFAMRFYPSRKAWRVFDLRKFKEVQYGRITRVQPSRYEAEIADLDAAIMFATLGLS
jgi:hypothetical protein